MSILYSQAYVFSLALEKSGAFVIDPVIVAGDFQISQDNGAYVNLTNLPVVTPAGSSTVEVSLTAAEMAAGSVNINAIDPDSTWNDVLVFIDIPTANSETLMELEQGDRIETSTSLRINRQGTSTPLLSKTIGGSLYTGTAITTVDT